MALLLWIRIGINKETGEEKRIREPFTETESGTAEGENGGTI